MRNTVCGAPGSDRRARLQSPDGAALPRHEDNELERRDGGKAVGLASLVARQRDNLGCFQFQLALVPDSFLGQR